MVIKVLRIKVSGFCVRIWGKWFGARPDAFLAPLCAWVCVQAAAGLAFGEAEQDQASPVSRSSLVAWIVLNTCLS